MSGLHYRFGPFRVERAGYRVFRDNQPVEITPKLLDLLLFLLDHAGTLVTKEQLLDALWPDANVTENALAQAVSELRDVLDDDAADPNYIKTVARKGYRFIADVATDSTGVAASAHTVARAIAVLDFSNVTSDPDAAWLSSGIADTVTADLLALDSFRVVDRWRVMEAIRRSGGRPHDVARELDVPLLVIGTFQRNADRIRIMARIVDIAKGEAIADAKVDGPLDQIFELQDGVVVQLAQEIGASDESRKRITPRETPSLEAYRAFTEGWLRLETLDISEIPIAAASFERALAADRRYALAYTGLASAQLALYENTREENAPAQALLDDAIANARHAVALDDTLAEAQATLALILVSAWNTAEAIQAARRAVALEPNNWRHFFRLGHASWGDERLRAASNTLALYPDFAFAHFQRAMVLVARSDLAEAETVLRQGAAVQDRQIERGERYPALGLHWLLALVRLAQGDPEDALRELEREQTLAQPHRLYGREYAMHAHHARGACLLRLNRGDEAAASFAAALAIYPNYAPSLIALAVARRAPGSLELDQETLRRVRAIVDTLSATRPVQAAVVESQMAAAHGEIERANVVLTDMLERAPAGFAAWTLPVDPLLPQLLATKALRPALRRLEQRAA